MVLLERVDRRFEGLAVHDALHGFRVRWCNILSNGRACNQSSDHQSVSQFP
jgi:hypothetical protein